MKVTPAEAATLEMVAKGLDSWFGKTRGGYDFWKLAYLSASFDTAEFFQQHMLTVPLLKNKKLVHQAAYAKTPATGLLLEFGVATGASINEMAEAFPDRRIYGFDSFEGLPEAWLATHQKGHFAQPLPQVRTNVELIVGWYDATLAPFLASHDEKVAFLHVDCDLYSSTKTVLDLLADRITAGTVVLFDEYYNYPGWREHEHKAFMEFVDQHGVKFHYAAAGRSCQQVVVVIDEI